MAGHADRDGGARWREFAGLFALMSAAILCAYLGLAWAVDPYDSGRSKLFSAPGLRPQGPRTAAASRGRDPAYAGAIIGNSHIQLIEPRRLSEAAGLPFVQLSIPATGPGEQLAVLDWFLRHHPTPQAIVLAADAYWCTDDPALPSAVSFPFWLLAEDSLDYLRGLLRFSVAEEVLGRIGWLLGERPRARADGWWDYETDYLGLGYGDDPRLIEKRDAAVPDDPEPGQSGPFPAAGRLAAFVERLERDTAFILVFPPVYAAGLPRPGTPRATADLACKASLSAAIGRHAASAVIDRRQLSPETRDRSQFFDQSHYRHPLARRLADEIAAAISAIRAEAARRG